MPTCHRFLSLAKSIATRLPARLRFAQERGQAMVEFAVVLPVLLVVIFGILYFGRYESYSTQMTQLAEQGARAASVGFVASSSNGSTCSSGTPSPSIACYVANQASGELSQGSSDVQQVSATVDCNPGSTTDTTCNVGDIVAVCLATRVQFPVLGIAAGTVYQQAEMQVESTPTTVITNSSAGPNPPSC
jgi:Flp pilus assembly protein TadG